MQASKLGLVICLLWASCVIAQVLSPADIKDPEMRALQQKHQKQLQTISTELNKHQFPYPFYFSRKLDVDEAEQKQFDQRSIRFDLYNKHRALVITGNYFAAYSDARVDADHRMRQTYLAVVLPILQLVVPSLHSSADFDLFAIEISHHVRRKVMGLNSEFAENMVVIVPRELAMRIVQAHEVVEQQNLMLDAEVYHNGEPTVLWLDGEKPFMPDRKTPAAMLASVRPTVTGDAGLRTSGPSLPTLPHSPSAPPISGSVPPELSAEPLHDSSPDALKDLQAKYQHAIDALMQDQGKDAHFVSYAPPAFISFKQGTYLQVALSTTLDANVEDSQYKLAALAFDRHVAHLVRPMLSYFKNAAGFDGIDFSTTVKVAGDSENAHTLAVEFILPLATMHCFQQYDCTGQQLLNTGIVLINGERAGLELQTAEAR
jgi:hypothetical protein